MLLVGPTGTGKTLLCESLARLLKVPFVTADATSLAQSRYVNDEIQAILERCMTKPRARWREPSMASCSSTRSTN